jgi:hypothetical protein
MKRLRDARKPNSHMSRSPFEEFESTLTCGGVEPALALLAEHFRGEKRFHELFDVRLMQARHRLELPIVLSTPLDELPEPGRTQLEDAYLEACREVGRLLLVEGNVREAWVYLRPAGETEAVAGALQQLEPTDDNLSDLVGLALHEGVAPAFGYSLILSHYGTCNAITTFDAEMGRFSRADQQAAAAQLVRHLHAELTANVRAHIKQQEGADPGEDLSLDQLTSGRDWLFEGGNYHIDTTHLSSAVRIARILEDKDLLRLVRELTQYGRRLDPQYQFAGEEPFVEVYSAYGLFYSAQLGDGMDEAVAYFRAKSEQLKIEEEGSMPAEVYIALLARLGRLKEAMEASARLLPSGTRTTGFAPSLLELSRLAGDYTVLEQTSREKGEMLAFAVALVAGRLEVR